MPSDEQLMADYVAGDRSAFAELFRRYAPSIRSSLARRLSSPELVDDLVQQTFLQMHRARNDFRAGAKVRPWLFTIAMNLARSHLRRQKRSPFSESASLGASAPTQLRDQERRQMRHWLDELPDNQREVILLYWFEGHSFDEIAKQLGTSLSAVKVRAHRGYKALRARLDQEKTTDESNPSDGSS